MAIGDEDRLAAALRVYGEIAVENVLSAFQARAFVRCLQTTWDVQTIRWNPSESAAILKDAKRLILAGQILFELKEDGPEAALCFRRAGELLEWLTRANDLECKTAPIELLAAAALQLGGLPAMASSLLARTDERPQGVALYARFLRADFEGVVTFCSDFWAANRDFTTRAGSEPLLEGDQGDFGTFLAFEIVRSIGLIADALRLGSEARLEKALSKLKALDDVAVRTFSDDASLLVTLLHAAAQSYKKSSVYSPARRLSEINPQKLPVLEAFARRQFSRGRGILWPSQTAGLSRLIESSSFALCTPTGSGKTLVATLAVVKELLLAPAQEGQPAPLAMYIVPSRALAGEVESKLRSEFGNDVTVTGLYGGNDWGITDYWLEGASPTVLIATVEKADALMRYVGYLLRARLRLLVVDEAHQVVPESINRASEEFAEHSSRSLRLESFVSRLLSVVPTISRIALTAVAGGASGPVARWIEGANEALPIGSDYRSTRQLLGVLQTRPGHPVLIQLDSLNGRALAVRDRRDGVYLRLEIPPLPQMPAAHRNVLNRYNAVCVLWTALHLIGDSRRILISVAQEPEKTMRWFKEVLDDPRWAGIASFEPDDADQERFDEARAVAVDYCGEDSYEVALLDHGIATNHGQMPQRLRRLMVDLIERKICPITVATATLTEGVNLPFDIIFLTSLKRRSYSQQQGPIVTRISAAEFRNLSGRAGRPGSADGIEGLTLVALPQAPSASAPGHQDLQLRQIDELKHDYAALQAQLAQQEVAAEPLSPLALLLKGIRDMMGENFPNREDFFAWLERVAPSSIPVQVAGDPNDPASRLAESIDELDGMLLSAIEELHSIREADHLPFDLEAELSSLWRRTFSRYAAAQEAWMERMIVRRGRGIVDHVYPDRDERRRLYQFGYTPVTGRRFKDVAPAVENVLVDCSEYGLWDDNARLEVFVTIGDIIRNDRGFGFKIRDTETDRRLLGMWADVLAWWMHHEDAEQPEPDELRSWQRFVVENLEFRLGVSIGAVAAMAWQAGANNPLEVPSLADWKQTTGLPWIGFWARELLRWGTLEPFVAFMLARGLSKTREDAAARKPEFVGWLEGRFENLAIDADYFIDPQLFLAWEKTLRPAQQPQRIRARWGAQLVACDGSNSPYAVMPVPDAGQVRWFDAAGYELAVSPVVDAGGALLARGADYKLVVDNGGVRVERQNIAVH